MPKLPVISGLKLIKAMKKLGFVIVRQRGSHVFLQRGQETTVVPLHDPLKKGTLSKILKQSNVTLEELMEIL
jgi:predicted RNA binding protein YcfA (HicA-like mRNA interferase family)